MFKRLSDILTPQVKSDEPIMQPTDESDKSTDQAIDISLGIHNPHLDEYLKDTPSQFDYGLDKETINSIKGIVSKAIKDGVTSTEIVSIIRSKYGLDRKKAMLIASTELGRSFEIAKFRQAKASYDGKLSKIRSGWKYIQVHDDDQLCKICKSAEQQGWVRIDKPYKNGMMMPPFHEGCRCCSNYGSGYGNKKPM